MVCYNTNGSVRLTMYQSRIRQNKKRAGKSKVLVEPEDGQEYAVVKDMLGNGRLRAFCEDGKDRIGRIRGSMRKYAGKVIIDRGDLILISAREFGNDDKVDVFHKFTHEDVSHLLKRGELPEKIFKALTHHDDQNYGKPGASDDYVLFMNEEEQNTKDSDGSDDDSSNSDSDSNKSESDIDIDAI